MYRDALEAAHKRIAELEAQLAGKPKTKRRPFLVFALGLGLVLAVGTFAVVALAARVPRHLSTSPYPTAVTTPPPAVPLAHDYRDALLTPFTTDVDRDGVEDVVAEFRLRTDPSEHVYVRAVSGRTFKAMWTAGPFEDAHPSNVAVVGDRVVVTTHQGATLVDLATGVTLRNITTTMKSACAAIGKSNVALLLPDVAVDVHTGAVSAPDPEDRCAWTGPNTCAMSPMMPCLADGMKDPGVHAKDHKVHGWTTIQDGERRVSYGYDSPPSRDHMVAAGAAAGTTLALWERDATLENEPMVAIDHVTNYQSMMAALDSDRFVLAYGAPGGIRVLARDAGTGALLWNTLIPDHPKNSALRTTAQRIYVHSDWHVVVLDGTTGAPLGTIGE